MKTTTAALGFLRSMRGKTKHERRTSERRDDEHAPSTRRRVAGAKVAGGDAVAAGEEKGRQTHAQGDACESDQAGAFVCRDEI
jgi:hypothetical protein